GRKRERLEARLPGETPDTTAPRRIAVIGAGIAGASLARAFRNLDAEVRLFDPRGPGGGASGNPAALVTPRLDAGLGPPARLFTDALRRAGAPYGGVEGAVRGRGVIQLATGERDPARLAAIAASDLFEPGVVRALSCQEASARLGGTAPGALSMESALVLDPRPVLDAWTGEVAAEAVSDLAREQGDWRVNGRLFDAVCIAAGAASAAL